jgi:hypothetical protein
VAFDNALHEIQFNQYLTDRDALFGNPDKLREMVVKELGQRPRMIREGFIDGRSAKEVLAERLACLPWPEFLLLVCHVIDRNGAPSYWLRALSNEGHDVKAPGFSNRDDDDESDSQEGQLTQPGPAWPDDPRS